MIEPGIIIPFIFGIPTIATVIFFLGFNIGGYNGMSVGKNEGIVYCVEKPKECKIKYEFLKLEQAENSNK